MAKRIGEGSLVCTKRTVPGLGIVLKRVKDINEYAGYNLTEEFYFLFDRTHDDYKFSEWDSAIWSKRQEHISKVNLKIVKNKPDLELGLLDEFWSHNRAYQNRFLLGLLDQGSIRLQRHAIRVVQERKQVDRHQRNQK
jgi:hypothetical protein